MRAALGTSGINTGRATTFSLVTARIPTQPVIMKFTLAFVLLALFAVLTVCKPTDDAAASRDDESAKPAIVEPTNDDNAEKPVGRNGPYTYQSWMSQYYG